MLWVVHRLQFTVVHLVSSTVRRSELFWYFVMWPNTPKANYSTLPLASTTLYVDCELKNVGVLTR